MADTLIELREIISFDYVSYKTVTKKEYVTQLVILTNDCPPATNLNLLEFNISSIKKVVEDYNNCKGNTNDYIIQKEKRKKVIGISAGISFPLIMYKIKAEGPYYSKATYTYGDGFTAGLSYYFDLLYARETAWLCNDLIIHKFSSSGAFNGIIGSIHETADIDFHQVDIKLITALKIQPNSVNFIPYFKLGFTNTYSVKNEITTFLIEENIYTNNIDTFHLENDFEKNNYHLGVIGSTGLSFRNKYFLNCSFERSFNIAPYAKILAFEQDIYISLQYAF